MRPQTFLSKVRYKALYTAFSFTVLISCAERDSAKNISEKHPTDLQRAQEATLGLETSNKVASVKVSALHKQGNAPTLRGKMVKM
jgi:hypothetical protein